MQAVPTQVPATSISRGYDRVGNQAFKITVKSSSFQMQETIAAKIESLAKIYFGSLKDEKNNIMFHVYCGPTYAGKEIGIRIADTRIQSVKRSNIIKYLDNIPTVGATVEDIERIFQTIPK